MYLTAHRVLNPGGQQGFNTFLYKHRGNEWPAESWIKLDQAPGELVKAEYEVEPVGGNRVRSYLDIVAPDHFTAEDLWPAVEATLTLLPSSLPCQSWQGPVSLRFAMEQQLSPIWASELVALARRALKLVP